MRLEQSKVRTSKRVLNHCTESTRVKVIASSDSLNLLTARRSQERRKKQKKQNKMESSIDLDVDARYPTCPPRRDDCLATQNPPPLARTLSVFSGSCNSSDLLGMNTMYVLSSYEILKVQNCLRTRRTLESQMASQHSSPTFFSSPSPQDVNFDRAFEASERRSLVGRAPNLRVFRFDGALRPRRRQSENNRRRGVLRRCPSTSMGITSDR